MRLNELYKYDDEFVDDMLANIIRKISFKWKYEYGNKFGDDYSV